MSKFKVGDKVTNNGAQSYGYSTPGEIRYVVEVQGKDIVLSATAGGEPVADGFEYNATHFDLVEQEKPAVASKEEIFFRTTSARTLIDVPFPLTESQKALVLSMLTMMQKP